jgi:hypothetical protein
MTQGYVRAIYFQAVASMTRARKFPCVHMLIPRLAARRLSYEYLQVDKGFDHPISNQLVLMIGVHFLVGVCLGSQNHESDGYRQKKELVDDCPHFGYHLFNY